MNKIWFLKQYVICFFSFYVLRLICPPSDFATSQLFIQGTNDTIYGKLYKDKMDGLNSFYPTLEAGMYHVLNSNQEVAYFQNIDFVNSIKETHCKVQNSIMLTIIRDVGTGKP